MEVPFFKYSDFATEKNNISDLFEDETFNAVEELEDEFLAYVGAKYAVSASHGTSALHLAMMAIDLKRGDKVLCSVNAFPNVPEVVRHFDAEPVFVDIEEDSYNMDLDKLEAYLVDNSAKKLKAVIVTHIAGQATNLERLYNIAEIYNVKSIEDASEALGATYNGKKIGATGADIVTFDFNPHLKKGPCNGGMLVCENEEILERAKLLRNHALVGQGDGLDYFYDVVDIGSQYDLSALDAAFILAQLSKQDDAIARQQEIAKIYDQRLKDVEHLQIPERVAEHSYSNYIIKVDKNRDSFSRELLEHGIETGLHYIPLHLLRYYKSKYNLRVNEFPVALRSYQQILSLPIYQSMSDEMVNYVCDKIIEVAKSRV